MIRLIKNEFLKLFNKKIMKILFILVFIFVILNNILYNMDSLLNEQSFNELELSFIEEELSYIDYTNEEENEYYIFLKNDYDLIKLKTSYEYNSWQYAYIENSYTIYDILDDINQNTYGLDKNEDELEYAQKQYNFIKQRLDSGDWESFLKEELKEIKTEISTYEEIINNTKDLKTIEEINTTLDDIKVEKEALDWRLEKSIPNDNSFLSNKIDEYIYYSQTVNYLKSIENRTILEEQEYNYSLRQMNICKYYIENDIVIQDEFDSKYILSNLMDEYGIIILVFSIIIAGTIVSNEFQKGTIKLLLTRPFSRGKILLSKYIVSILSIFIFVILFAISQYFVGGLFNGFDVYGMPVVEYDLNTNSIVLISVFEYLLLVVISSLPMYIICITLAFALSTITMSSAAAIAIPILGYTMSEIINLFIEKISILKYFVTANWNLSTYLFGGIGVAEGLTWYISLFICLIYLAVMLAVTFAVFKGRDVKNV